MSEAAPSRLDDYLDAFVSPKALFTRRSDGKFGQALLVLVVLSAILFFATKSAMAPIMDAEMAKGMAGAMKANPNMTPEQMESAKAIGAKFASIGFIFIIIVAPFLLGTVIFLRAGSWEEPSGLRRASPSRPSPPRDRVVSSPARTPRNPR